jgi:hypothetical protein
LPFADLKQFGHLRPVTKYTTQFLISRCAGRRRYKMMGVVTELTLFRILPVGVESKKDIGAWRMQWSIFLKNFSAVSRPTYDTSIHRPRIHNALPIDSDMYTEKRRPNPTLGVVFDVGGHAHAIQ